MWTELEQKCFINFLFKSSFMSAANTEPETPKTILRWSPSMSNPSSGLRSQLSFFRFSFCDARRADMAGPCSTRCSTDFSNSNQFKHLLKLSDRQPNPQPPRQPRKSQHRQPSLMLKVSSHNKHTEKGNNFGHSCSKEQVQFGQWCV